MYKIVVFIPETHSEKVKNAMFDNGAGKIGDYDSCSFETRGTGQFRPLPGSNPYIGKENLVEKVEEVKVEMVCPPDCIKEVVEAMKNSHPYEMPAYDIIKLVNRGNKSYTGQYLKKELK